MKEYAVFWLESIDTQSVRQTKVKRTWYGGRTTVPLDTPVCGFKNELCQTVPSSDSTFILFLEKTSGHCLTFLYNAGQFVKQVNFKFT